MTKFARNLTFVFAAGSLGGLLNSLIVWYFGNAGIASSFGVKIAPALTPAWLYPRIVWGGLWGFLFLLPMLSSRLFSKGLILSLGPTLVQLFVIFPYVAHKGVLGTQLGAWTPVFVLFYNGIWGGAAGVWLRWVKS